MFSDQFVPSKGLFGVWLVLGGCWLVGRGLVWDFLLWEQLVALPQHG